MTVPSSPSRPESIHATAHCTTQSPTPFLQLHAGGVHLVIQRVPYRLLAALSSLASAVGGAVWATGR